MVTLLINGQPIASKTAPECPGALPVIDVLERNEDHDKSEVLCIPGPCLPPLCQVQQYRGGVGGGVPLLAVRGPSCRGSPS